MENKKEERREGGWEGETRESVCLGGAFIGMQILHIPNLRHTVLVGGQVGSNGLGGKVLGQFSTWISFSNCSRAIKFFITKV